MVISSSPFPSESTFTFEALPQNCLLGAAEVLYVCRAKSSDSYRDVNCIGVAICAKCAINLPSSCLLSPEGEGGGGGGWGGMGPRAPFLDPHLVSWFPMNVTRFSPPPHFLRRKHRNHANFLAPYQFFVACSILLCMSALGLRTARSAKLQVIYHTYVAIAGVDCHTHDATGRSLHCWPSSYNGRQSLISSFNSKKSQK